MAETWLRPNRRVLALGAIVPALAGVAGLTIATSPSAMPWLRIVGGMLASASAVLLLALALHAALPRLAYRDGHLVVRLHLLRSIDVPIELVECFLWGQTPTMLPGKRLSRADAAAVVVRLAESATDWAQRPAKPALGAWCGGYITIRGTWCEPLSVKLVERLNARLFAVVGEQRAGRHA